MISLTEGLYASLLTVIESMSVRESWSRLTSENCPTREKICRVEHLFHGVFFLQYIVVNGTKDRKSVNNTSD
jgi:hypothetical protein